ncbi:MAG: hypothetical protein HZA93_13130 [Verrucomicrobia bacterium]|nr:hypothetical protein [Verrucomicrobiota bacterium]
MSALLHLGEAAHKILNADAEIAFGIRANNDPRPSVPASIAALSRARAQLTEARAALGAVRLALRTQAVFDALEYHDEMALRLREGARLQRVPPGHGLHASADMHEAFAAALRVLIGTPETPTEETTEGGAPCHVV